MKRALLISFINCFVVFLACYALSAGAQEYKTYCNDRYGFCVDYPDHLTMEPPPFNGDGRKLNDGKGFVMIASGINNVLDDTLKSEMRTQGKEFNRITFRAKGKNWFVLSGYKGSETLYRKTYVGKGTFNHLYIQYPSKASAVYNEAVTKISGSFKPGDLDNVH